MKRPWQTTERRLIRVRRLASRRSLLARKQIKAVQVDGFGARYLMQRVKAFAG